VTDDSPTGGRGAYRPPVGFPEGKDRRWRGLVVSIAIHTGIILLLLIPAVAALIITDPRTAGMLGLPGGGGGSGPEHLHFIENAPPAAAPVKPKAPQPVPPPVPPPRVAPAQVPPPTPPPTPAAAPPNADTSSHGAPASGTGGPGAGPGTGGGTGAGTGTGIGNGKGPGTGGEGAAKIKATAKLVTAYSVDPPKRPRPFHLVAVFEVAPNGASRLLSVNKADDGDFNKKMRDHLLETEFRPATLANGTPVTDTVVVTADY
jgi:hypothetical protein